jgi:16S rRNA (guanine527-N7)-methyltransferase
VNAFGKEKGTAARAEFPRGDRPSTMPLMNELWTSLAGRAGIELKPEQHAQLSGYLDLLTAANERMNLTRITDRASAELLHIADALTLLSHLPPEAIRIADIGSGGGVPGIPLAIARPDARFTLIEATKKKAAFLEEAAKTLGLTNVRVAAERAEDAGQYSGLRAKFDVAVCRAVGTTDWLVEWCLPLVKVGGKVLAMKGPKVAEELPLAEGAIRRLGGGTALVHPSGVELLGGHVILEIPKVANTNSAYPRSPTLAKGAPLR